MSPGKRRPSRPGNTRPARKKEGPRKPPAVDPARRVAFDTLQAIRTRDAYANLVLPELLRERGITGRDAALATELTYGSARLRGLLDEVIAACADRALSSMDGDVLDALRLGVYQLMRTRVPAHAAVAATVDLVRATAGSAVSGFANAVLRRAATDDEQGWVERLAPPYETDPIGHLAIRTAHPAWIVRAFAEALGDTGTELAQALEADNTRPEVHLVTRPDALNAAELAALTGGEVMPYSPYGVRLDAGSGDLADSEPIRQGLAAVQDEGSQLCARALAEVPLDGKPDRRWLDLCAGPGGKARLLGALAASTGAHLDAVDTAEHRAALVREAVDGLPVTVHTADGRASGLSPGYDRVLVDAPCTGLGALRRRPEARWRRSPSDVADLTRLQGELLAEALRLTRSGGVVCYVVCTFHLAETEGLVGEAVRTSGASRLDARPFFPGVPDLGGGPDVQLWPHRHGTDAMYCALLRKP
ncbi:transcription antitermination factor NusB [Haloechinothrix sp. LS1_15]|uniref:RsmB/NOP family class I SAM-dependent RNA methyltransferase n=1 Tax=Haloechinothrix sp. LS1_15 TaxID=2652248 RepID=UPI002946E10E|nr:transcription antitermination factor NusB [Haloechinothrix sp. LS1_15]MDV6013254.1 rRNA small subunit methyltransferase B [Haloechinothrix sp. LS1_15]